MPNLLLDRSNYQVNFSGSNIPLSDLEFEILWQLVNKPGKVFSADDLYNSLPEKVDSLKGSISKIAHLVSYKLGHPGIHFIQNRGFTFCLSKARP